MMKTISFSILFSILQLFFNPLFFAFLQQFTAGENLKVAGEFNFIAPVAGAF